MSAIILSLNNGRVSLEEGGDVRNVMLLLIISGARAAFSRHVTLPLASQTTPGKTCCDSTPGNIKLSVFFAFLLFILRGWHGLLMNTAGMSALKSTVTSVWESGAHLLKREILNFSVRRQISRCWWKTTNKTRFLCESLSSFFFFFFFLQMAN